MSEEQSPYKWWNDRGDGGTIHATSPGEAQFKVSRHRPDENIQVEPLNATEAGRILRHVADIVDGHRNRTHGDKERSFAGIARAWERIFGWTVRPSDVARAMVALKEQRMRFGELSQETLREHVEDVLGYWAIYYELRRLEGE